jgi:site-specific DNA-adenine methylase
MKPILKWTGGKSSEIPIIEKYMPKSFDRYIEPFLGGGALYFHLEHENCIVNDFNRELMSFYTILKIDFYSLYDILKTIDDERDMIETLDYSGDIFLESDKVLKHLHSSEDHDIFEKFLKKEYSSKIEIIKK